MSLRSIPEHEPAATLLDWRIHEVQRASLDAPSPHVVGYALEAGEGRVSSAIVELDVVAKRIRTKSGRLYFLSGESARHPDADYVWNRWLRIHEATLLRELTLQELAQLLRDKRGLNAGP